MRKYTKLITSIENVRKNNNKYWMDMLRLSFKFAPKESQKLVKKINQNDKKISTLLSKLSKIN
tara:strand:+ start:227 stop:415 length:189 start_codon:yes stop_codon:yes gene_type:complete